MKNSLVLYIIKNLKYFWHAKKIFTYPEKSEIIIFDATNHHLLLWYLHPFNPTILHVGGEQINIPILIKSLFKRGNRFEKYIDEFIKNVQPKLIVTFIDNNRAFYSISKRHASVKTMFIQNGIRGFYVDVFEILEMNRSDSINYHVDYMLTCGPNVAREYQKYIAGTSIPIGSYINNYIKRNKSTRKDTIAYISQFRRTAGLQMGDKYIPREKFFEQADKLVLSFLIKYAQKYQKELYIIPVTVGSKKWYTENDIIAERVYYETLLNTKFKFYEGNHEWSCYDGTDEAEVTVGIDSTLCFESAMRGNKTAIFSIRTFIMGVIGYTFGWPRQYDDIGPFWTNIPDNVLFEQILNNLFSINSREWNELIVTHKLSDILSNNSNNTILSGILDREILQARLGP